MNTKVNSYLIDGCGRCAMYRTPQCKVNIWQAELKQLRKVILDCGLREDYKWSQPCYTFNTRNILLVSAFNGYACVSFFKGSLLKDRQNILIAPGKSSQSTRQIRFTDTQQIVEMEADIKAYVHEAVELEKKGIKVQFKKNLEPFPDELIQEFAKDQNFKMAFNDLTPGRQRGYILHFSQPKQSKTRATRIENLRIKILNGEGLNDNYRSRKK